MKKHELKKNEKTFEPLGQLEMSQYPSYMGCQKEKNNTKKLETYLNK